MLEDVSARVVGYVRIGLGAAAVLRGIEAIRILYPLTDPDVLHFPWFDALPALTPTVVTVIVVVWLLSAVMFTVGRRARLSGGVLTAVMAISMAFDQQAYSNHLYLLLSLIHI